MVYFDSPGYLGRIFLWKPEQKITHKKLKIYTGHLGGKLVSHFQRFTIDAY